MLGIKLDIELPTLALLGEKERPSSISLVEIQYDKTKYTTRGAIEYALYIQENVFEMYNFKRSVIISDDVNGERHISQASFLITKELLKKHGISSPYTDIKNRIFKYVRNKTDNRPLPKPWDGL